MSKTRKALFHSLVAQYFVVGLQFVTSIVIARLMMPEEVGIYSLAASLILVGQILRDFGTGQYILIEPELTRDRIRAALTVTIAMGWSIAGVFFALAGPLATLYETEAVADVIRLLAINFMLMPFGTITSAMIRRDMNFGPVSVTRISSAATQSIVVISCAVYGLSYMSMVWGAIANTVTSILVINFYRPRDLPFLPGFNELRRVFSYGYKLSGMDILTQTAATIPEMIVGKVLGFHDLGLLSRARGTMGMFGTLITNGVAPVVTPYFSEIGRKRQEIKPHYKLLVELYTSISWPFFGCLIFLCPYLVEALFGKNWVAIVPLIQIICISVLISNLTAMFQQVLKAINEVDRAFKITLNFTIVRLVIGGMAAFHSLTMVALSSLIIQVFFLLIIWKDLRLLIGFQVADLADIARNATKMAFASTTFAALLHYLTPIEGEHAAFINLLIGGIGAGLCYVITLLIVDNPLRQQIEDITGKSVQQLLGRSK